MLQGGGACTSAWGWGFLATLLGTGSWHSCRECLTAHLPLYSNKREEASSQIERGASSGEEKGAGEAATGCQRTTEQQETH